MYIVYQITDTLNGKIYVGAHVGTPDDDYMGSGLLLTRAQKKHGLHHFVKETLALCDTEAEMFRKEREIVNEAFIAREDTYNLCVGGDGGPRGGGAPKGNKNHTGHQHSAAARAKMSEKNCMKRPEVVARMVASNTGRTKSPEAIEKQRAKIKEYWAKLKQQGYTGFGLKSMEQIGVPTL